MKKSGILAGAFAALAFLSPMLCYAEEAPACPQTLVDAIGVYSQEGDSFELFPADNKADLVDILNFIHAPEALIEDVKERAVALAFAHEVDAPDDWHMLGIFDGSACIIIAVPGVTDAGKELLTGVKVKGSKGIPA